MTTVCLYSDTVPRFKLAPLMLQLIRIFDASHDSQLAFARKFGIDPVALTPLEFDLGTVNGIGPHDLEPEALQAWQDLHVTCSFW